MSIPVCRHFKVENKNQQCWIYFDKENASVNTLDLTVMNELETILEHIQSQGDYQSVVLASAKKRGFIAGADIHSFEHIQDLATSEEVLKTGHRVIQKLENLKIPTLARIDGFCLGGGLEIVLACQYRIMEDNPSYRIGLPEVNIGIHPGWGGCVRLPRLIGGWNAMPLIVAGRTLSPHAAKKLGIVDEVVPKRQLDRAVQYYLQKKPARQQSKLQALTNHAVLRPVIAYFIRKQLSSKVKKEYYPAPFAALDCWSKAGVSESALAEEIKSCSELFLHPTAKQLVRIFNLREQLKSMGKDASRFSHVHVVGAGTMGGDIAAWCALRGLTVTLQDVDAKRIAPAMGRAAKLFSEKLKLPHLVQAAKDRLIPDIEGDGIAKADIIIEAILEDLTLKQQLFSSLEKKAKPDAILASNTSSILLDKINEAMQNPERLVGIHFFNPVPKMQLVEIVSGEKTQLAVAEKAKAFVKQIDRLPLPVKSAPGFLVNRILVPYLLESMALLSDNYSAETIDAAMLHFGMPMGPITLADTVGLDVCFSVANYLGVPVDQRVRERLEKMIQEKKLGRKTGEGFYRYDKKGKTIRHELPKNAKDQFDAIKTRLVLAMLNEAFACLREGVVANADLLDAGMIFGTGFAPFRGGLIQYAKQEGIEKLFSQYSAQKSAVGQTLPLHEWVI